MAAETRRLWIVGTSVSIERGGYVSRLEQGASEWQVRNLSVGDQTSMMGLMRLLMHRDDIAPGDVVVWEYSLLDHLLTEQAFDRGDVRRARRQAWNLVRELGAGLIVLFVAPREELGARTPIEREAAEDAAQMGAAVLDVRALFTELRIPDPHQHYRDDRHVRADSPLVPLLASRVREVANRVDAPARALEHEELDAPWRFVDAKGLAQGVGRTTTRFGNSLMAFDALRLQVDESAFFPATRRVVALGIVATHASGGAWCGHESCPPASTRLPQELPYDFLLRVTGVPCIRAHVDRIASAPGWAYRRGFWCDYGQALSDAPGEIALFGALLETAPFGMPADIRRERSLAVRLERRLLRWWRG